MSFSIQTLSSITCDKLIIKNNNQILNEKMFEHILNFKAIKLIINI
jgi:hypothetical protein